MKNVAKLVMNILAVVGGAKLYQDFKSKKSDAPVVNVDFKAGRNAS